LVGPNHFALRGFDLFHGERQLHAQDFGAVEQAFGVFTQTENGGALGSFVSANTFERTASIVQGVGQDVYLGIFPFDKLAIHPDLAITLGKGHGNCGHKRSFNSCSK
jgi:hypothetical protein